MPIPNEFQLAVSFDLVIQCREGLQQTVLVEGRAHISILEPELLALLEHLDFFEWSHLERMIGRIMNSDVGNVHITENERKLAYLSCLSAEIFSRVKIILSVLTYLSHLLA